MAASTAREKVRVGRKLASFQGRWFGKLNFDAESGVVVSNGIASVMEELYPRGDAAAALRSLDERRAEALVELVRRGLGSDKAARPLVLARIDLGEDEAKLDGGPTDLDNLIPLCSRHHHLHHDGTFAIAREDDVLVVRDANGFVLGDAAASPLLAA